MRATGTSTESCWPPVSSGVHLNYVRASAACQLALAQSHAASRHQGRESHWNVDGELLANNRVSAQVRASAACQPAVAQPHAARCHQGRESHWKSDGVLLADNRLPAQECA